MNNIDKIREAEARIRELEADNAQIERSAAAAAQSWAEASNRTSQLEARLAEAEKRAEKAETLNGRLIVDLHTQQIGRHAAEADAARLRGALEAAIHAYSLIEQAAQIWIGWSGNYGVEAENYKRSVGLITQARNVALNPPEPAQHWDGKWEAVKPLCEQLGIDEPDARQPEGENNE